MDNSWIYLVIVGILFLLAISDLIVGVSNDAVNFLNSAIGSKAATYKTIMIIAALGVLVGATFSNGMMEVARKGIFNPDKFYFADIMIIFLAVMITDIILLDLFNTFGLPTSTTVSIVFELLGAAVAMAFIKVRMDNGGGDIAEYINTSTAMKIIFGILLSVVISFTVGALIQSLSRLLFTFNYDKTYKYFGAMFGGLAIAAITYFILIKGAKGTSFISSESMDWIKSNTGKIMLVSFVGWTILLQLLMWLFKINVLKLIVLVGTFSLAMAFAGNDLVNFIGVPLAGFESFVQFSASEGADPNGFLMDGLTKKIQTPTIYLLIAGIVMVLTLWFSKKAKSVTQTSLDLSRQDDGDERFGSSAFARVLVREGIRLGNVISSIVPSPVANAISGRFASVATMAKKEENTSFDLVRASVTLIVASVLIAIGTSLKLPLSTTYVTFMVAMGTSLADGAWNRESAVYRITGVFAVIGGWFFTAFAAFTTAFLIATLINWGGIYAIAGCITLAILLVVRTHIIHKKKVSEKEAVSDEILVYNESLLINKCTKEVSKFFDSSSKSIYNSIEYFIKEKRKALIELKIETKETGKHIGKVKKKAHNLLIELKDKELENAYTYLYVIDQLEKCYVNQKEILRILFEHVDNNHKPLSDELNKELKSFMELLVVYVKNMNTLVEKPKTDIDKIIEQRDELFVMATKLQKKNLKLIKKGGFSTKTSITFQGLMNTIKQYVANSLNLLQEFRKYQKDS